MDNGKHGRFKYNNEGFEKDTRNDGELASVVLDMNGHDTNGPGFVNPRYSEGGDGSKYTVDGGLKGQGEDNSKHVAFQEISKKKTNGEKHKTKEDVLREYSATSSVRKRIHQLIADTAEEDGTITKESFFKTVGDKKGTFFADRFFSTLDTSGDLRVDMLELEAGLALLLHGSDRDKIDFIFRIYDVDDSGRITIEELRAVLQACVIESNMNIKGEHLDYLTDALFTEADIDGDDFITPSELYDLLQKYPDVLKNITQGVLAWILPKQNQEKKRKNIFAEYFSSDYIKNNAKRVGFLGFMAVLHVILFIINAMLYRDENGWIIFARGCGICIDFDASIIVLLVLRRLLTILRSTKLMFVLPLDDNIYIHKLVGILILIWSVGHTFGHLGNAAIYLTDSTNATVLEILFTDVADMGWVAGLAPVTGVALLVILVLMVVLSMPFVRKSGYFELFYWSHKLYWPFFILSVIHAKNFWKWFIVPGLLFVIETIYRFFRSRHRETFIRTVNFLPSGVTQLNISRPSSLHFQPGDYVFLNLPGLTKYEWHPFTISSAPEMAEDEFWVHIRSAGHWTRKIRTHLMAHVEQESVLQKPRSERRRASSIAWFNEKSTIAREINMNIMGHSDQKQTNIKILVDGPYGSPTREIFDTDHAVLIGSGIGITPFASILQSIMYRFEANCVTCPGCARRFHCGNSLSMKLKKVDFVWICRDQQNFEWFTTLLAQLERRQCKHEALKDKLTLHLYMTGARGQDTLQGMGVQVALDIVHNAEHLDLITGLQTRTKPGRPNWDTLFTQIKQRAAGKVKVYQCGSPLLAKAVRLHCMKHGFGFVKENF